MSAVGACEWNEEAVRGRGVARRSLCNCDNGRYGRRDLNAAKTIFIRGVEGKKIGLKLWQESSALFVWVTQKSAPPILGASTGGAEFLFIDKE